jgi:LCP family protein required for cell wall assembly
MSGRHDIDEVIAGLAQVGDEDLRGTERSPEARALFEQIVSRPPVDTPAPARMRPSRAARPGRRPLLGGMVAVASVTVAVGATVIIVALLGQTRSRHPTTPASRVGRALTVLVVGSDRRPGQPFRDQATDTIELVRLNAGSATTNVLSIPHDLAVEVPATGTTTRVVKLNAVWGLGGPRLLIDTLRHQVLPGLTVNHVLLVDLAGLPDLIDALGCVDADVDHRYYNAPLIDLQPGYQTLCGADALAFLRADTVTTGPVRSARQADFLRWAEQQYPPASLLARRDRLLETFREHVQYDPSLATPRPLLDLFDLLVDAWGHPPLTIPLPLVLRCPAGTQSACAVHVAGAAAAHEAYRAFLAPTPATTGQGTSTTSIAPTAVSGAGLTAAPGEGRSQAAQLGNVEIPVLYPTKILSGSSYCSSLSGNCDDPGQPRARYSGSYPRRYVIEDPDGSARAAYVLTLAVNRALGEYYTVQGTSWQHPPILDHPTAITTVGATRLYEYADNGRIAIVALRTRHAVYWITNTLTDAIPNAQMVAIAASLTAGAVKLGA